MIATFSTCMDDHKSILLYIISSFFEQLIVKTIFCIHIILLKGIMFWTNWNYHCLGWSHTSTLGQHSWPIGFKEQLKSFFSKYSCVKIGLIVAKPYPCGSRFQQNTWNIAVKEDCFCLHIRMLTNDPFPLSIVVPTYPRGSQS